jgi:hypothetical protein
MVIGLYGVVEQVYMLEEDNLLNYAVVCGKNSTRKTPQ